MKKKRFQISIPKPCSQSWENMRQNETGRLCASCAKEVMDFSSLSDQEIIRLLGAHSGRICGRLHSSQLNRTLIEAPEKRPPLSKMLAGILLFSFANAVVSKNTSGPVDLIYQSDTETGSRAITVQPEQALVNDSTKNTIRGKIMDKSNRELISFAGVHIKNTHLSAATNIDGEFKLYVPDEVFQKDSVRLQFNYVGYASQEISFSKKQFSQIHEIFLSQSSCSTLTGEIEIIPVDKYKKKKK